MIKRMNLMLASIIGMIVLPTVVLAEPVEISEVEISGVTKKYEEYQNFLYDGTLEDDFNGNLNLIQVWSTLDEDGDPIFYNSDDDASILEDNSFKINGKNRSEGSGYAEAGKNFYGVILVIDDVQDNVFASDVDVIINGKTYAADVLGTNVAVVDLAFSTSVWTDEWVELKEIDREIVFNVTNDAHIQIAARDRDDKDDSDEALLSRLLFLDYADEMKFDTYYIEYDSKNDFLEIQIYIGRDGHVKPDMEVTKNTLLKAKYTGKKTKDGYRIYEIHCIKDKKYIDTIRTTEKIHIFHSHVVDTESKTDTYKYRPFDVKLTIRYGNGNTYEVVEGADMTITQIDKTSFKVNAPNKDLDSVVVDKKIVDEDNYKHETGSTIITFTNEYIDSLKTGEHELTVLFNSGSAKTTFTVSKNALDNPATFDNINIYIILAMISVGGLLLSKFYLREN